MRERTEIRVSGIDPAAHPDLLANLRSEGWRIHGTRVETVLLLEREVPDKPAKHSRPRPVWDNLISEETVDELAIGTGDDPSTSW